MKETKIGVISDTHLRGFKSLPLEVWKGLDGTDLILHAGDVTAPELLDELNCLAPTYAVQGNCDGFDLNGLPTSRTIEVGGYRIGITHGHLGHGRTTPERAYSLFRDEGIDVVVFGHSHQPLLEKREDVILFNPGSPTAKRSERHYSFGIITIKGNSIEAVHHFF